MNNDNLICEIENIYNSLRIPPQISKYSYQYSKKVTSKMTKQLNDELYTRCYIQNEKLQIKILNWKVQNNLIIISTNIGHFTLENTNDITNNLKEQYNIIDFYEILKTNTIPSPQNYYPNHDGYYINQKGEFFFNDFFNAYYWYKMVREDSKRLYLYLNHTGLARNLDLLPKLENLISIETVTNKNFNNYAYTPEMVPHFSSMSFIQKIQTRFENICSIESNPYLIFTLAIYTNDQKYFLYLKENIDLFKKFILEETSIYTFSGNGMKYAHQFLKENQFIQYFTKEELIELYQKNPKFYYYIDKPFYLDLAKKIENKTPLVQLEKNSNKMVHIRYHNYDLYDDCPVDVLINKSYEKKDFLTYFLFYNQAIEKIYNLYYKSYQKIVKTKNLNANLEDFCACLFQPKNLEKICNNSKLTYQDLKDFLHLKDYFGPSAEKSLSYIQELSRQKNLNFYNKIISLKDKSNELELFLNSNQLNEENIFSFIINNKFLYSKEKGGLLRILNDHYHHSLTVDDIIELLEEMQERKLTINEILKEKEITKKDFERIYTLAKIDNPLLWKIISDSLVKNKKRGYLKIIYFGYKVLNSSLTKREEYEEVFSKKIPLDTLLEELKNTELYDLLLEKFYFTESKQKKKIKR